MRRVAERIRAVSVACAASIAVVAALGCGDGGAAGNDAAAGSGGNAAGSGGNTAGSGGNAAGSGGSGGTGTGGHAAGAGGVGGVSGVGGRGGTGVAGSGGAAGDDRLLPLEAGRRWTFQISPLDPASPSTCTRMEASVVGPAMAGAEAGWIYAPTCATSSFELFANGDDIRGYPSANHLESERIQYASPPVQEGFSWQSGTERYVWHDAQAVQTPAGRFDRCWQRSSQTAVGSYIVLCRGVGLVVVESMASNYRLELASKNF